MTVRRLTCAALLCFIAFLAGQPAGVRAANVTVNNYNWMQINSGVLAGVGSPTTSAFNTSGFSGHNDPTRFRWSDLWIPSSSLNNNLSVPNVPTGSPGKGDYWSTVALDQARHVERVDFRLWNNEGTGVRRVRIEGSTDGVSFSQIGLHDFGSMQQNNTPMVQNIVVTPGNYTHVRLRFNGTDTNGIGNADYLKGQNDSRSGPGVWQVELLGDGAIATDKVNWANQPNFSTVASNSPGLDHNGLNYNDGLLCNSCGAGRAGEQDPWGAGKYTQVNLGQNRLVGESIVDWNDGWGGSSITIEYFDGSSYTPVTGVTTTALPTNTAARRVTFNPVIAQNFRITKIGPDGNNSHYIFDEWMLFSPLAGVLNATPADGNTINFIADTGDSATTPITLQNIGTAGSAIGVLSYTITGPDAALFDLSNFAQEILDQNESIVFDLDFLGTPLEGLYSAQLLINTSEGLLTYDLTAFVAHIPEPSSFALLGLGLVGAAVNRRRRRQK